MTDAFFWAPRAWLPGGWRESVLLEVDAAGRWTRITPGVAQAPAGARVLAGPVLPGMVDAHSHAFQRAFAGLSERRAHAADDFWSWRDRMYGVALRVTPDQMQAIAAQLYLELLRGGYTHVCEFHYLHHAPDGSAYADPATLCWALADAAAEAGMGLTLLPVLYERAGFLQPALRDDQRRFRGDAPMVLSLQRAVRSAGRPLLDAGVAIHSLRAASAASITQLNTALRDDAGPIHIHIAEQVQEVDDCLAATGLRPIAWLCRHAAPDARWHLVHATHATQQEIDAVASSGATAVICPGTEANLGDGLTDIPAWLAAGVPLSIGSDSHVTRDWTEELRWLEYGQRLRLRQRNVAADPAQAEGATAARLFDAAIHAGGRSAGQAAWGLVPGARADALVLDTAADALRGIPPSHLLDALVFSGCSGRFREVMVAGRSVLHEGRHPQEQAIAARFSAAMDALWNGQAAASVN
jgi:formimidoylglutamate deiminase